MEEETDLSPGASWFPQLQSGGKSAETLLFLLPTAPNLRGERNNGGTPKLFRKAHLVEIWDVWVRQPGEWLGLHVKREWPRPLCSRPVALTSLGSS